MLLFTGLKILEKHLTTPFPNTGSIIEVQTSHEVVFSLPSNHQPQLEQPCEKNVKAESVRDPDNLPAPSGVWWCLCNEIKGTSLDLLTLL